VGWEGELLEVVVALDGEGSEEDEEDEEEDEDEDEEEEVRACVLAFFLADEVSVVEDVFLFDRLMLFFLLAAASFGQRQAKTKTRMGLDLGE
jgi:hypothetical protein